MWMINPSFGIWNALVLLVNLDCCTLFYSFSESPRIAIRILKLLFLLLMEKQVIEELRNRNISRESEFRFLFYVAIQCTCDRYPIAGNVEYVKYHTDFISWRGIEIVD